MRGMVVSGPTSSAGWLTEMASEAGAIDGASWTWAETVFPIVCCACPEVLIATGGLVTLTTASNTTIDPLSEANEAAVLMMASQVWNSHTNATPTGGQTKSAAIAIEGDLYQGIVRQGPV